jgi:hypothetical protein
MACTQFFTCTVSGTRPAAITNHGATKYASLSPIASPTSTVPLELFPVGTGPNPVEVEKVIDCPQSVTDIGSAPMPVRTLEQMAEEVRVYRVEQPELP